MTDIRRTLLWVVFTMSLVLLWDGWNKHTGQPSMFSASPRPAAAVSAAPAGALPASQVGVPTASATGALPVATTPQLYLQLCATATRRRRVELLLHLHRPGVYTDASKFQKIDFKDIEKGNAGHDKAADNGWVAMVQHYFASAWLLGPTTARASSAPRR
jgi:hypothetical protein